MPQVPPILTGGAGFAFDAGMDYTPGESLVGFAPATGAESFRTPLALGGLEAAGADLVATGRSSLLLLQREHTHCDDQACDDQAAHLREFGTDGGEVWTCAVPIEQYRYPMFDGAVGSIALSDGQIAVVGGDSTVRGYAVPGATPAGSGWIALGGSMQRAGRPR